MKKRKLLILSLSLFLMSNTGSISYTPFLDTSSPISDLNNNFKINYLDNKVHFIEFSEYKYGSSDYSLYFYSFIPSLYNFDKDSSLNKIQIKVGNFKNYKKYNLKYLNDEDNVYKFKLDLSLKEKNEFKTYLESTNRVYKISGLELKSFDEDNANEYKIGGEYSYSGYAKGCNNNSSSTLFREVTDLETIDLDVKSLTYREKNESRSNKTISYESYDQINSVYFNVDNELIEKYGNLKEINAEYYEYRTAPIFVLRSGIINYFESFKGINISENNRPNYELVNIGTDSSSALNRCLKFYSSDNECLSNYLIEKNNININATNKLVYLFDGGENGDIDISSDELKKYMNNYNYSYDTGKNYKGWSNDLFNLSLSEGYQNITLSDEDNILTKESSYSLWEKFLNKFGNNIVKEKEFKCLEKVDYDSISSSSLFIDDNDLESFKKDVKEANDNNSSTYIFRFDSSTYDLNKIFDMKLGDLSVLGIDGYVAQENIYLDFDIISLTFGKEGNSYIIPAISNPIDIIDKIDAPDIIDNNKLLGIIKTILGILVILASLFGLNFIFNLLGISIKDIINFLFVKPFKWIKKKLSRKKRKRTVKKK